MILHQPDLSPDTLNSTRPLTATFSLSSTSDSIWARGPICSGAEHSGYRLVSPWCKRFISTSILKKHIHTAAMHPHKQNANHPPRHKDKSYFQIFNTYFRALPKADLQEDFLLNQTSQLCQSVFMTNMPAPLELHLLLCDWCSYKYP